MKTAPRPSTTTPPAPPDALQLLVFGIDGATWDIIDPLIARGRLPHLARLRQQGSAGRTLAEYRASPSLWTSIFTGKRREKHGISFFGKTGRSVRAKRLWEIAAEQGWTIGICGPLVSWPPKPVRGFIIPDLFAPGPETYPPEFSFLQRMLLREKAGRDAGLSEQLADGVRLLRNGLTVNSGLAIADALLHRRRGRTLDKRWREILLQPRIYGDVFVHLCRRHRPHFAAFHFHAADTISHQYWKFLQPEKFTGISREDARRFGPIILRAYEVADAVLGRALRLAGPQTTVLVLSDHGFMARPEPQFKYELRFDRFVAALGLNGQVLGARFGNAFALDFTGKVDVPAVIRELEGITISSTGAPLFDVRPSDENLSCYLNAPHDLSGEHLRFLDGRLIPFEELFEDRGFIVSGQHHPEGVCILAGAGVQAGVDLGLVPSYDLAPTLLALAGLPVAEDMDGRPRLEAITPAHLAAHPIRMIPTYESSGSVEPTEEEPVDERILHRLKGLGYL